MRNSKSLSSAPRRVGALMTLLSYINTYNSVINAPTRRGADDRDFEFRMVQALQMFGDKEVTDGIQLIIDNDTGA